MNYLYKNWLKKELSFICQDLEISDINFDIVDEQDYIKMKSYSEETIYIVIKKYNSTPILTTTVQPLQLLILTQEYNLENTTLIFNSFIQKNQLFVDTIHNEDNSYTYIKHEYQNPASMSNFIEVGVGRRSVLYVPVTLTFMENNVSLIRNISINDEEIKVLNLSIVYNMQGNTQQIPSKHLSETVKSVAITGINITIQAVSDYNFVNNILDVMFGEISGNLNYNIKFDNSRQITMKLSNIQYGDTIDGIPSLQVGFTV